MKKTLHALTILFYDELKLTRLLLPTRINFYASVHLTPWFSEGLNSRRKAGLNSLLNS